MDAVFVSNCSVGVFGAESWPFFFFFFSPLLAGMPGKGFLLLSEGLRGGLCSWRVVASVCARVRGRSRTFACVPEALCRWDLRPKVSRWACRVVVSRSRRVESLQPRRRAPSCVAGAANCVQQVKLLDCLALCGESDVCVCIDMLRVAKSWQAQVIR